MEGNEKIVQDNFNEHVWCIVLGSKVSDFMYLEL